MFGYIARRLAFGAVTIVGVSIVVFLVMRILPGDPLVAVFGPEGFTKLSDAERAHLMAELGLSDPLIVQYFNWVKDIARGNFGRSFFRAESVADMIMRRGPLTAEIAAISVVLSWIVGIPVAIVSALRPNSAADNISRFFSILFLAIPGFWLGMLIVLASLFWFGYRPPLAGVSEAGQRRITAHRSSSTPAAAMSSCTMLRSVRPRKSNCWIAPAVP
jgi:peptide/nickel transport system permease protein